MELISAAALVGLTASRRCTALYSTALYCTALYSTALYSTALYSTALYSPVQHCTGGAVVQLSTVGHVSVVGEGFFQQLKRWAGCSKR